MKIVEPFAIGDANLVDTNVLEALPVSVSAVSYNAYSSATTYAAGTTVCHTFTTGYPYASTSLDSGSGGWAIDGSPIFAVFTAIYNGTVNWEPGRSYQTGTELPGIDWWTRVYTFELYDAAKAYAVGAIVGYSNGTTGAIYQSLVAGNTGNTPSSSPTSWRQATPNSYATYSAGTTYGNGEQAAVFAGYLGSVFTSLQAGNIGHTPSSSPTYWQYEGAVYMPWNSGTTYALGDVVTDLTLHHEYEAAQGSNTNHDPADSTNVPTWWLDRGPTNRWAAFDTSTATATSNAEEVDCTIQLSGVNDTLALLGMTASSVQVLAYDGVTLVYDQTITLTDDSSITDWRRYFCDPITFSADLIITDLPTTPDLKVRFVVSYPGGLARIGIATFGLANELGGTIYGATAGILSFSRKVTDDFGNPTLVPRPNSKRGDFKVAIDAARVDNVLQKLAALDAVAVLYIGTDTYASTWSFGFYRDHSVSIDYPTVSYLTIQIEGLV